MSSKNVHNELQLVTDSRFIYLAVLERLNEGE